MGCSSSSQLNSAAPSGVKIGAPSGVKILIPQPTAGYLHKQGQNFPKSWKKRFFVLKEGTLVYYRRETFVHSNIGEEKLDALLLKNFVVEGLENNQISLQAPDNGRKLLVETLDPSHKTQWVAAFKEHIAYLSAIETTSTDNN